VKVCSKTFLSLSWPKLLSEKYWFSWFSGSFSWYSKPSQPAFGPAQPDTQPVFSMVETGSSGFCTVHFFASLLCQPKSCARLFENRFNRFWDRFNWFLCRKVKNG
jgi:hypothetical protein